VKSTTCYYHVELSDVIAAAVAKANVCWFFFLIEEPFNNILEKDGFKKMIIF
jgi:hypothetical protein